MVSATKQGQSVKDFGARGDGRTDDSPAIQRALDSENPVILIPEGTYLVGRTLRVPSDKTIEAHPDAILRFADGAGKCREDFLLTNRDHRGGNRNIVIRGGVWDGNNEHNFRGKDGDMQAYTGAVMDFSNVENLELSNLTVKNPDSFSIRIGVVRNFRLANIVFSNPVVRANQDGVHIGGFSENGIIQNLRATTPMATNDDMVAINADDGVTLAIGLGLKCGPIRNIEVDGVFADSVYSFVRILSTTQPVENIRIRNVVGGVRRFAVNLGEWRFPKGSGNVHNVRLSDFRVRRFTTEYLDDPGFGVCHLKRTGNVLGYDSTEEQIALTAYVSYPDPLVYIGVSVHDLTIENLVRTPEDTAEVNTLFLDNQCRNTVELDGFSDDQLRRIEEESKSSDVVRRGATFETSGSGKLVIPNGSIGRLRLNAECRDTDQSR